MKNNQKKEASFNDQLILFRFFLNELGIESLSSLSNKLNSIEYEGLNENGNTYYFEFLSRTVNLKKNSPSKDKLRIYDENICRHTRQISEKRGNLRWKYFQYLSLLFTEMYLDRYFSDIDDFCEDLNKWIKEKFNESIGLISYSPYTKDKMNKLAFMSATGSGKTLIMHVNILQYLHYFKRAKRINSRLSINKIIVLAPNDGMSNQHLEELTQSSISAAKFEKDSGFAFQREAVIVIDMNKLKEEGKIKTVSVDSFEQNNLVLVDEGHRGLSGNIWYDYRNRLSSDGFAFEYSATFKQALNANSKKDTDNALMEEYGKSILIDYSYKYFYEDGYGKDYRIYNIRDIIDNEQQQMYLSGCLLSFYQQMKLFETKRDEILDFNIEKPLLVFVGNRVTSAVKKSNLNAAEKELLTDVEEVLNFINVFTRNRSQSISRIKQILENDTGLIDNSGNELFYQNFIALNDIFGRDPDPSIIFTDILRTIFNTDTTSDEPRLHLENIKQSQGEIGLKIGEYGEYFGVINIGDPTSLIKSCEKKGIIAKTEEFVSDSLFNSINSKESNIKILIGSRKFSEGWNSWRVSTMGLINFAKGEGSQAIQLFGRGVRLKGYNESLKRTRMLNDPSIEIPRYIEHLETLTIFGVKAQYMEDFKNYLELEGTPNNEIVREFRIPVISRFKEVMPQNLRVIKVKEGANFKKQARRMILEPPDNVFLSYLLKNKTIIDCRSKIHTIESTFTLNLNTIAEEIVLPQTILPVLDLERIFEELEIYKNEKHYFNITLVIDNLLAILSTDGWYGLLIPKNYLKIDSYAKLYSATDYAILALKSYMDKFYKFEKERWEAPLLEFGILDEDNRNLVDEYSITYTQLQSFDKIGDDLENFISEITSILQVNKGLDEYKKNYLTDKFTIFDFTSHLYAPLISIKRSDLNIQVSPVALNEDEMVFVDLIKEYTDNNEDKFIDISLHLLRNKSKSGMGFFEAGNFYPDYILWIDTKETQFISFIDPKGLMHTKVSDPKIEFYKTIKNLQERLHDSNTGKKIVLNSFIISGTPAAQLRQWWKTTEIEADRAFRESKNVYTLDNPDCVKQIIEKILNQKE